MGLVVAPLLLAVPLAALGVRRPAVMAVLATGLGFGLVKTTVAGSAVASEVWSAVAARPRGACARRCGRSGPGRGS